ASGADHPGGRYWLAHQPCSDARLWGYPGLASQITRGPKSARTRHEALPARCPFFHPGSAQQPSRVIRMFNSRNNPEPVELLLDLKMGNRIWASPPSTTSIVVTYS